MNDVARYRLLRRGFLLASVSVAWNIGEGVLCLAAGAMAASVALVGFGVDSLVETASAVVICWRLWAEMRGRSAERVEAIERRAARVAGTLLIVLALYILVDAGSRLFGVGRRAEESVLGIVVTSLSLVVMPVLGWAKLRTARALGSAAVRADAYETIACAWLSLTTLSGLALNAAFGWWWADPLAALVLVPLIVREGLEGLRGEDAEDDED